MMKRYLPVIFTIFAVTFTQTWASHDIPDYDYDLDGGSDNNTDIEITPPGGSTTCTAEYSHSCTMEGCSDCRYYNYVLPSGIASGYNTCKAASCANGYTKTSYKAAGCSSLTYYTCEKTKVLCLNCSCQTDIEYPQNGYIKTTKRKCDQDNDCKCIPDTTTFSCTSSYYQSGTTVECKKKQSTDIYSCSGCTSCPSNATCDGSTTFKCKSTYYKSGDSCKSCPSNATCTNGTDFKCNSGFYKPQYSDSCTKCPDHSTCTSATNFTCNDGFYKSGNSCASCPNNATCNDGTNFKCNSEFYKPQDSNSCKACPNNYNTCNNDGFTCKDGTYKTDTECKDCPTGATCDGSTTFKCKSTYYKSGDICKSCGSIIIGGTKIDATSNVGATSKSDCWFPADKIKINEEQTNIGINGHTATIKIKSCY